MFSVFKKSLWTKELTSWYLYDFANSLISINMIVYFSQWIVVDNHISDFWFSIPVILATIMLIFLSTHIGSIGDKKGTHFNILLITSILTIISVVALIITGRSISNNLGIILALVFFGFYQLFYQLTFVPYNAFIKHICSKEEYGKVSGIGYTASNIGSIVGLLITLPLINHSIGFFGSDRLAPLILGLALFFIFSLPTYFVFRNKKFPKETTELKSESILKSFWKNLKESRKYPGVFPLLLSFYLFSDAIATLTLYSAIYMQKVFLLPDEFKVKVFIVTIAGFAIGSFIGGILSDKYSHRKILSIALLLNAVSIFIIAFNKEVTFILPIFLLFGLTAGIVYASSRSYLDSLIPEKESGKFFGLYTFAERFASVIGPAIWGITILIFATLAPANYRIAAFVMGVLVFLGALPFIRIRQAQKYRKD